MRVPFTCHHLMDRYPGLIALLERLSGRIFKLLCCSCIA
jgi:hypothetical protein